MRDLLKNKYFILKEDLKKLLKSNKINHLSDDDYNFLLKNIIIIDNEYEYPFYISHFSNKPCFEYYFNIFIEFLLTTKEYKYFVNKMIQKFKYLKSSKDETHFFREEVAQEINYLIVIKGNTYVPAKSIQKNYILSFLQYMNIYETFLKRRLMSNQASGVSIPTYRIEKLYQLKNRIQNSLVKKKKYMSEDELIKTTINYLLKSGEITQNEIDDYMGIFNYMIIYYDTENNNFIDKEVNS
jgi:hypothetical protein